LLNNATKYTEPGGQISVGVMRSGEELVEIRVKDSGLGISPELLPRLFNLFTQSDSTTHRAQGGLGIGLALVRKLVEMHGGTVAAYSQGASRGSEFLIRLPLLTRRPQRRSAAVSAAKRERTAPRRILVADDNADSLESLAALLRCDGHEVYTACDGEQSRRAGRDAPAADRVARHRHAETRRRTGRSQNSRRILGRAMTLIALTGWGQDADRKRTAEAGFDAHLVKPLEISELSVYLELPAETVTAVAK